MTLKSGKELKYNFNGNDNFLECSVKQWPSKWIKDFKKMIKCVKKKRKEKKNVFIIV